jgi:phage pi2 protein 07
MLYVVYKLDKKMKASYWTGDSWSRDRNIRRVYRSEPTALRIAEEISGYVIRTTSVASLKDIETCEFSDFFERVRNLAIEDKEMFSIIDIRNSTDIENLSIIPHVQNLVGKNWTFENKELHKLLDDKIAQLKKLESRRKKTVGIAH